MGQRNWSRTFIVVVVDDGDSLGILGRLEDEEIMKRQVEDGVTFKFSAGIMIYDRLGILRGLILKFC